MRASNSSQRFSYQCRLHIYVECIHVCNLYAVACIQFRVKSNIFTASSYEYTHTHTLCTASRISLSSPALSFYYDLTFSFLSQYLAIFRLQLQYTYWLFNQNHVYILYHFKQKKKDSLKQYPSYPFYYFIRKYMYALFENSKHLYFKLDRTKKNRTNRNDR